MASCFWVATGGDYGDGGDDDVDDVSRCEWTGDGDGDSVDYFPGCCVIADAAEAATLWAEKCTLYESQADCLRPTASEQGPSRCSWVAAPDDFDCTQFGPNSGCCAADSASAATRCAVADDRSRCEWQSDCHWVSGEDAECPPPPPGSTVAAGCCSVSEAALLGTRWDTICLEMWTEGDCLRWLGDDDRPQCEWHPVPEGYDCSLLWPREPAGCCAADNDDAAAMCRATADRVHCERMSSCHWAETEDPAECLPPDSSEAPGCCTMFDQRPKAFEEGWNGRCTEYWTESECQDPVSPDGYNRCYWTPTDEHFDCQRLWPTEQPTASPAAGPSPSAAPTLRGDYGSGCCAGDSPESTALCIDRLNAAECGSLSSCHWISTDDAGDCRWRTTEEAMAPGCCMVAGDVADFSNRWIYRCIALWSERDCLMAVDGDDEYRCQWVATPSDFECSQLWPTEAPPDGAGCCSVSDALSPQRAEWEDRCRAMEGAAECLDPVDDQKNRRCQWTPSGGGGSDCGPNGADPPPPPPKDPKDEDCGCCASDCEREAADCGAIEDGRRCDDSSSCHWIAGKDAECSWDGRREPSDPGCCVVANEAMDAEWNDECAALWNDELCGGQRQCRWVDCAEHDDCSKYRAQPQFEGHLEVALFDDLQSVISAPRSMQSPLSLLAVGLLAAAAVAMHTVYRCRAGADRHKEVPPFVFYDSM